MNYKSFTQIVVLGSSTFVPFMRLPVAQRREIIEDILDIQIFSVMNTKLKEKLKVATDQVKDIDYQSDLAEEKVAMQESFIKKVEEDVDNRINERKQELKSHLEKKNSLDLQYFSLARGHGICC